MCVDPGSHSKLSEASVASDEPVRDASGWRASRAIRQPCPRANGRRRVLVVLHRRAAAVRDLRRSGREMRGRGRGGEVEDSADMWVPHISGRKER
jgi:hypothetical protein